MDAKTLRQRRLRVGIGQEKHARLVDISCYSLSSIEIGRRPLSTTTARRRDVALSAYERALSDTREQLELIS
jgi:hypothetical protein